MVDRVAIGIHDRRGNSRHTKWEDCADEYQTGTRRDAHAAIAAMRKPTPEIIEVLERLLDTQGHSQTLEESWALLVDEALR